MEENKYVLTVTKSDEGYNLTEEQNGLTDFDIAGALMQVIHNKNNALLNSVTLTKDEES